MHKHWQALHVIACFLCTACSGREQDKSYTIITRDNMMFSVDVEQQARQA
jgi:hypothetical protein